MKQIFIFGSSFVYGVGSTFGGWAGLVKNKFHNIMFGEGGIGEKFEVFNFGKSGATMDFVKDNYKNILKNYKRNGQIIALVNMGGNNMKAKDTPKNYVSSLEEFEKELEGTLKKMKKDFDKIIFVNSGYVDESKTNPKPNPLTGGFSYFTNERKKKFNIITQDTCKKLNVEYVDIDISVEKWIKEYISEDGLHANDNGYRYIFDKVWSKLQEIKGFIN